MGEAVSPRPLIDLGYEARLVGQIIGRSWAHAFQIRTSTFLHQLAILAMSALPLVGVAHFFAGMVVALQSGAELARFGSNHLVPDVLALAIVTELAPIFTALLMAGKAGAGLASELGMLTLTGQTQAMRSLSVDIDKEVVAPRFWATVWGTVLLTVAAVFIALLGGLVLSAAKGGVSPVHYMNRVLQILEPHHLFSGLAKAAAFGTIVATLGLTFGLKKKKSAADLGRHTMQAVVIASFLILISDHLLTSLIMAIRA